MKPWFWPGLYRVGRGIPQLSVFQGGSEEQRLQGWCNKGRQISRCLLEHRSTCVHQRPDIASEVVLLVVGLALLCLTRPPMSSQQPAQPCTRTVPSQVGPLYLCQRYSVVCVT